MKNLQEVLRSIGPLDSKAMDAAQKRLDSLTKPPGSLGRLEAMAKQLAGITANPRPHVSQKAIFTLAADHGVAEEGVSAYPQEVTAQMIANFSHGGAAICVLARAAGARLVVVDMGVKGNLEPDSKVLDHRIGPGTANMAHTQAMSRAQAEKALQIGMDLLGSEDLVGTGDMGIANTTAASAITAAITGQDIKDVTGFGTGIDEKTRQKKIAAIEQALEKLRPDSKDGLDILSKVGGFEIGGIAGLILGAASRRVPILIDGFISGAGALVAATLAPACKDFMLAAHRSAEPGHRACLDWLGLKPILELDLRLGEGTGAALAMPLVEAACRILDEMATFEQAGVSDK